VRVTVAGRVFLTPSFIALTSRKSGWQVGTPSDRHLFGSIKKHLARKRYATDDDVKQAVTFRKQAHYTDFCYTRTQALVSRWDKWLNMNGDCADSGVHHVLPKKKVKQSRYRPGVAQRVPGS
jgi:hypothetical protein